LRDDERARAGVALLFEAEFVRREPALRDDFGFEIFGTARILA